MSVLERPSAAPKPVGPKRRLMKIVMPFIIMLLGVSVLVYPVVSTQWNNIAQRGVAERYAEIMQDQPESVRAAELIRAEQYNAAHTDGPILDPWLSRVSEDNVDYQEYLGQLSAVGDAMAQVVVPAAGINLPIYHGSDENTLERGVGHLYGSALPVGGVSTHAILTGHTGLSNATLFDNLAKVQEGDAIYINVYGQKMKYVVDQMVVVLPHETDELATVEGRDLMTLITCTPYGINTHRLLVRATRVEMDEAEAGEVFEDAGGLNWQWWMWVAMGVGALVLLAIVLWLVRLLRRTNTTAAATGSELEEEA